MNAFEIRAVIKKYFPALWEEGLLNEIETCGKYLKIESGTKLIEIGSFVKQMPLLVRGTLKISREDDDGNELLLYYLNGGDTCAMSLTCCMSDLRSNVRATAIEDAEIILLPTSKIDMWVKRFDSWKNFVFRSYQNRFDELLQTIDSIAFMKMDERLEHYLYERSKELNVKMLKLTHQEIANDLNTSREVISRLLKQFERMERIKLHRFKIELI